VIDEQKEYVQGVSAASLRGRIGKIERVSEETMNVRTRKGNVIVSFSQQVQLLQDNKPVQKKDIEVDSDVILIGRDEGEDFVTQRVIISRKPLQPTERNIVVGNVVKTDRRSITVVPRNQSTQQTFVIDARATTILDNESESIPFSDIEVDQDVLLIVRSSAPSTSPVPSPASSSGTVLVLRSLGSNN
jgi:uncharacterized protein (UPF0335 family)